MIRSFAVVNFRCPHCGSLVQEGIDGSIFWHQINSEWNTVTLSEIMQCYRCSTIYGLSVNTSSSPWVASVVGHPDVRVDFRDALGDEEQSSIDSPPPPEDPYSVLIDAHSQLVDIVAAYGSGGPTSLSHTADAIKRMVYASAFAAMEAFLADRLIIGVEAHASVFRRVLQLVDEKQEKEKTKRIPLTKIYDNEHYFTDAVRKFLRETLYYDVEKVGTLYRVAFGIKIYSDEALKARFHKAMSIRHDIVHRNGKTTDGAPVNVDAATVKQLLEDVKAHATHVNIEVEKTISAMGDSKLT